MVRAEAPALDEIPLPDGSRTEQGLALRRERGRPFERGNKAAMGRRPILAALAVPLAGADPRYKRALAKGKRYLARRVRELSVQCGGELGAGPCAMLAHAARATAASVLLYELAGEKLDAALFAQAARLGDAARTAELTAVGLAEREAAARSKRGKDGSFGDLCAQMVAENAAKDSA